MSRPVQPATEPKRMPLRAVSEPQGMVLRRQLLQCMAENLTQRQYQVFVLNFLEGMTQQEIAKELHLSRSTVSRAASVSRYKLRRAMGYDIQQEDYLSDRLNIFPHMPYPVQLPGIHYTS